MGFWSVYFGIYGGGGDLITYVSTKRTICIGTSIARTICEGTTTNQPVMVGTSMKQRTMIGTDP